MNTMTWKNTNLQKIISVIKYNIKIITKMINTFDLDQVHYQIKYFYLTE